jgi:hypothetical protein
MCPKTFLTSFPVVPKVSDDGQYRTDLCKSGNAPLLRVEHPFNKKKIRRYFLKGENTAGGQKLAIISLFYLASFFSELQDLVYF